jgi:hypothetical protein
MANVKHNGRVTENMEKESREAEATEYVRQLSDPELVGLAFDLQRRAATLAQAGVPLPMQQLENHHLIGLLSVLVGPEDALRVKEWHLSFVDRYFDQIEAEQRIRMLSVLDGQAAADLPGFP